MSHIETGIDLLVSKGNIDDMHWLKKVTADVICELKPIKPSWYKEIEKELHVRNHGIHLLPSEVKCLTALITNKDGSKGEHWDYDGVEGVMKSRTITCNTADFYFAINMIYAMYANTKFDLDMYVCMAHDYMRTHDLIDEFYKHKALLKQVKRQY